MSKGVHFRERQTRLLPYNKVGLDRVEDGLDQREPQRALKTCVWVQRTDPPLKMKTHIWT